MRKKRSDWISKCIDTFLTHTHIILSPSIWQFRENILNTLPSPMEQGELRTATLTRAAIAGVWDGTRR